MLDKMAFSSGRPELPKKPVAKNTPDVTRKNTPSDASVFGNKPWVSKKQVARSLATRSRGEIKRELHILTNDQLSSEVKKIQERVTGYGKNVITRHGAKEIIKEARKQDAQAEKEKSKGGFTYKELQEVQRDKNSTKFLEKKFGLRR